MSIKNLVFSGAEIRGISYIGIIKAIEDLGISEDIKNILGVSSGAVFALTLVLGLTSFQLEKIIMALSIDQLFNFSTDNMLNIEDRYGIDDGEKLQRIFKILFKKILNNENATFRDLHIYNPDKNLIIVGTNLHKKSCEYFSYDTTPDMPLHIAIRISYSIPLCFKTINYNNVTYIDGAFSNNFPINYFKDTIDNTIGVIFSRLNYTDTKINTLGEYMSSITECVLSIMPNYLKDLYSKNIIEIDVEYNILEFKFNSDVKRLLIDSGYNQFKDKYKKKFGDNESIDINKSDIKSSNENVDEMIKDMNREIHSIDEKNKVNK